MKRAFCIFELLLCLCQRNCIVNNVEITKLQLSVQILQNSVKTTKKKLSNAQNVFDLLPYAGIEDLTTFATKASLCFIEIRLKVPRDSEIFANLI